MYDGYGTCTFKDGHEYKGELRLGLLWGRGVFKWTDGTVYSGMFKENEITSGFPSKSFDNANIRVQYVEGIGTVYNKGVISRISV